MYYIHIMNTAIRLVSKEVSVYSKEISIDYSKGYKTRQICDKCQRLLVNKFDK